MQLVDFGMYSSFMTASSWKENVCFITFLEIVTAFKSMIINRGINCSVNVWFCRKRSSLKDNTSNVGGKFQLAFTLH